MPIHPYWAIVLSVVVLALVWLAAMAVLNAIVAFLASPWFPAFAVVGIGAVVVGIILWRRS